MDLDRSAEMPFGFKIGPFGIGHGSPEHVAGDFVFGAGTAFAPPLVLLMLLAVCGLLARREDSWGASGLVGILLIGIANFIGLLGEPNTLREDLASWRRSRAQR